MAELTLDRKTTALVVIDLQKGIAGQLTKPYPARDVVANASRLAAAFRKNGMPVFLVHVIAAPEIALRVESDTTFARPSPLPADWAEFVPELGREPSDIEIVKRQWGAFYGTELELQLRRRGMKTIVLCGISTEYGVESTARFAYEYGFSQVFAGDAMASSVAEESHEAAIGFVFRRMGRVRKTAEILAALA